MRIMQNTLYVTTPNSYLRLDGENVVIEIEGKPVKRVPIHNLEGIVTLGYGGASPRLMDKCAKNKIGLSFLSTTGRFYAKVVGETTGNITLRKKQFKISDDENQSSSYARNFVIGKLFNTKSILKRFLKDHALRVDVDKINKVASLIDENILKIRYSDDLDYIRGVEGESAKLYFSVFDELILQQKQDFIFKGRNKRPPTDAINAMLSFLYTVLAHDVSSALTTVGLDPYAGFLHRDRSGRISLALDLMEELRPIMVDRLVITLINKQEVNIDGFIKTESGAVIMDDETKKAIINTWQTKKKEEVMHPFLDEKISWGLIPYSQALLLARTLREDLEEYPPFLFK